MNQKIKPSNSESKPSFADQYKHPLWQKKRLSIIEMSGWRCHRCHRKDKELHVHHLSYERDRMPWEYPDSNLVCLCETCHSMIHNITDGLKKHTRPLMERWCVGRSCKSFDANDLLEMITMILCMDEETSSNCIDLFKRMAGVLENDNSKAVDQ